MKHADTFKIDSDGPPDGFVLTITTDEGDEFRASIQMIALEVEAEVRRELRPYAIEAEHARMTLPTPYDDRDLDPGYDPTDPKHPMYHALVSELTDTDTIDRARRAANDRRRPW